MSILIKNFNGTKHIKIPEEHYTSVTIFAIKSSIHSVIDMIGAIGICSNTLLNSIILLAFDGLVQTSALELLGVQKWWNETKICRPNLEEMKPTKIKLDEIQSGKEESVGNGMPTTLKGGHT